MTPDKLRERAREAVGGCTCIEGFKSRNLTDPDCTWCNYGEDVVAVLIQARDEALEEAMNHFKTLTQEAREVSLFTKDALERERASRDAGYWDKAFREICALKAKP